MISVVCAALLVTLLGACAPAARQDPGGAIDPALTQLAQTNADSVVAVLIRVRSALNSEQRARLEQVHVKVGSVLGDVITGRIAARDVARAASLPFVASISLSRDIPVHN